MKRRGDENGVPTIAQSIPLALFGFGLFVGVPLTAIALFADLPVAIRGTERGQQLAEDYRVMLVVTTLLRVVYFVILTVAARLFFARKSTAPRAIKAMLILAIAMNVIESLWAIAIFHSDRGYWASAVDARIGLSVFQLLWLLYFSVSRRVRETFVYPLAGERTASASNA